MSGAVHRRAEWYKLPPVPVEITVGMRQLLIVLRMRGFAMKKGFWVSGLVLACVISIANRSSAEKRSVSLEERAKAALAEIRGTKMVHGLQQGVRVQRDRWGVAHIYAQSQHDLFFAQGFVVAQDRLFQMELWKRSGQGRLAEILGPSAEERDRNARLLRYRGDMDAEYKSYAPDTKEILEAFTAGINAYIEVIQKPGGSGCPSNFRSPDSSRNRGNRRIA